MGVGVGLGVGVGVGVGLGVGVGVGVGLGVGVGVGVGVGGAGGTGGFLSNILILDLVPLDLNCICLRASISNRLPSLSTPFEYVSTK